jgi:hypothetical protein
MRSDAYIQWYNENEQRAYPIAEDALRVDDSGQQLPDDILVDVGLLLTEAHDQPYVSSLRLTSRFITIGISTSGTGLFAGTYLRSDIEPYKSYPLTALVDDAAGWIAFGNKRVTGTEDYRFSSAVQSRLELRTVHLMEPPAVTRFTKYGGRQDRYVDGIVQLEAGQGVEIVQDDTNPQKIIIRLTEEMKTVMVGPCNEQADKETCGVPPIREIDGVCPDENGRITIRFE